MQGKSALITFLGKNRAADGRLYREAAYRLPNGAMETARMIGLALAAHLSPDRLVVLGTAGSSWDLLLHDEVGLTLANTDSDRIISAAAEERVQQTDLAPFEESLGEALGREVALRIIPKGASAADQQRIIETMAEAVSDCQTVQIDVTHGLRHLPMVSLAASQFMQQLQDQTIEGLYYGALELTEGGVTPVIELDGLLKIDHWIKALHTYDKDGDYGAFVPLLEKRLPPEAIEALKRAAFYERTMNVREARGNLKRFIDKLETAVLDEPAEKLFMPELKKRIVWAKGERLAERQTQLARHYLESRDYLRAALLAWEALITHQTWMDGGDIGNFDDRKNANEKLQEDPLLKQKYKTTRNLRNALAHGERSNIKAVQVLLNDEDRLHSYLDEFIGTLSIQTGD